MPLDAWSQKRTAIPVARAELKAILEMAEKMASHTAGLILHESTSLSLETLTTIAEAVAHKIIVTRMMTSSHGVHANREADVAPMLAAQQRQECCARI